MSTWQEVPCPSVIPEPGSHAYVRFVEDGVLQCVVSPPSNGNPLGWHLSISHVLNVRAPGGASIPGRYPTWDEISEARYRFLPDEVEMVMHLPPRAEYVNHHPTTFHLWQSAKQNASERIPRGL